MKRLTTIFFVLFVTLFFSGPVVTFHCTNGIAILLPAPLFHIQCYQFLRFFLVEFQDELRMFYWSGGRETHVLRCDAV
jgi:hypothetical protein